MPTVESLQYLQQIQVKENQEKLVLLTDYVPDLILGPNAIPLVRQKVATKLVQARASLPAQVRFFLKYGLRTIQKQTALWNRENRRLMTIHPDWPKQVLVRETNKRVAPVHTQVPPGHCTGGAIDVFLTDQAGQFLMTDMPPYAEDWSIGHTHGAPISAAQQDLRNLLLDTMTKVGFSNYPLEYWHYSYGDSAWAARNHLLECPYGPADTSQFQELVDRFPANPD